jgi:hypothetical protein
MHTQLLIESHIARVHVGNQLPHFLLFQSDACVAHCGEILSVHCIREIDMRRLVLLATCVFLIVTSSSVGATPLSPAGIARSDQSAIILVQDKP